MCLYDFFALQILAESLSSILLLEESSPRQVYAEFLLSRKSALQEIFHPSQHGMKRQVLFRALLCDFWAQILNLAIYNCQ